MAGQGTYSCGAFSGWVVLLCVDKSRQPGFKRLLEAGGAKVTGSRPPFKNTQDFSHAFLGKYFDISGVKLRLNRRNIVVQHLPTLLRILESCCAKFETCSALIPQG